ncbi:hypothetical protein IWX49DRAFT_324189 [Phyllosticta citricarpa]|uniref:Uncharacterized protein n=2 Tax=Phyllosticta TaxID=121621 RepID=A0ABR1L3S7_9PEZI
MCLRHGFVVACHRNHAPFPGPLKPVVAVAEWCLELRLLSFPRTRWHRISATSSAKPNFSSTVSSFQPLSVRSHNGFFRLRAAAAMRAISGLRTTPFHFLDRISHQINHLHPPSITPTRPHHLDRRCQKGISHLPPCYPCFCQPPVSSVSAIDTSLRAPPECAVSPSLSADEPISHLAIGQSNPSASCTASRAARSTARIS